VAMAPTGWCGWSSTANALELSEASAADQERLIGLFVGRHSRGDRDVSGQRKALIVANDEYEQEGLQHLLAPAADAEALGGCSATPGSVTSPCKWSVTSPRIRSRRRSRNCSRRAGSEDVLLLHFSCHGLKSESGELFSPRPTPARTGLDPQRSRRTSCSGACSRAGRAASCCWTSAMAGVTVRASGDVNVLGNFPQDRLAAAAAGR
jgi:hypothetical protein